MNYADRLPVIVKVAVWFSLAVVCAKRYGFALNRDKYETTEKDSAGFVDSKENKRVGSLQSWS